MITTHQKTVPSSNIETLQQEILASLSHAPGDSSAQCKRLQPFLLETRREACQIILNSLVQLHFTRDNACEHWDAIVKHAIHLRGSLDRTVGLATAACDYFSTINPKLTSPKLIERDSLEEAMQSAYSDFLTGLLSRGAFQELFEQEISRAKRHKHNLTLIFFDLDNFKDINDTHGHLAGDEVLKRVGRILLDSKRMEDIACRYGGDEFIVLLPETGKFTGTLVAEKLHRSINSLHFQHNGQKIQGQCSAGLASFPQDGDSNETLIECADKALYQAKKEGRGKLILFSDDKITSLLE